MPVWTQTPEGRAKMSQIMKKRFQGPEGKKLRAALSANRKKHYEARRAAKAESAALLNGHGPSLKEKRQSGRAMINALARDGAIARRKTLIDELEKLNIFLAKTEP